MYCGGSAQRGNGTVTLIGATTENPSFEVIRPLLSRAQVYTLNPLSDIELNTLFQRAIANDTILVEHGVKVESTSALFRFAGGDARKLLNILDLLEQATNVVILSLMKTSSWEPQKVLDLQRVTF